MIECICVHHNALTCLAEREGMSRFNAMLVFAKGTTPGACSCPCHRDTNSQPIGEQAWASARAHQQEAASAARFDRKRFLADLEAVRQTRGLSWYRVYQQTCIANCASRGRRMLFSQNECRKLAEWAGLPFGAYTKVSCSISHT